MRSLSLAAVSATIALALIGCAGAPSATLAPGATQPPGVPTQAPGVPTQAPGVPTQAPPPVDVGSLCAGTPTYNPEVPTPSFAQDEVLKARFPTQIDGQPVTSLQATFWLKSMCYYAKSADSIARFVAIFPAGTAPQISSGYAQVEIDGESVSIFAFRIPGADPNLIFSHIPEFVAALGGDATTAANDTVTTTSIGGKSVYVVDDHSGSLDYDYVSGDTVWSVSDGEAAAAKVFAAIQ